MQFNSIRFLLFFPIVLFGYFLSPKKARWVWLLIASYIFYMSWNAKYALLIATSTIITYLCGLIIGRLKKREEPITEPPEIDGNSELPTVKSYDKTKKFILALGILINLAILFVFKYLNFSVSLLNSALDALHLTAVDKSFDLLLPVGISFYTFQALGYVIDVYRGDVKPERNPFRYALFVSFFPQLVAGPIERSGKLMSQLNNADKIKVWNYERIVKGFIIMMWGYFMKVVISDRAAIVVNEVFNNFYAYDSFELIIGAVLFSVQIYCDFAGYSTIALGAAKIMGFELMDNFDTPYFSMSIKEFWRRWHISLSTWFRDYLYIPLGGNRKGKFRRYLNTLIVFLVSGLWHGANSTFVLWGGIHGFYQIIGDLLRPVKDKFNKRFNVITNVKSYKLMQIVSTFALTCLAWIFFRANNIQTAFLYIGRIFTRLNPWALSNGTVYQLGLDRQQIIILFFALATLFLVDLLKYKKGIRVENITDGQNRWLRPLLLMTLIFTVIIFGAYGYNFDAQQFIYFQF